MKLYKIKKENPELNINKNIKEFYVEGMHCSSCEITIETALEKHMNIKNVSAKLDKKTVTLELLSNEHESEIGEGKTIEKLQKELNDLLKHTDYKLQLDKTENKKINIKELIYALGISLIILGTFFILQKLGIVNILNTEKITLPFVFLIGIVASLSTCMAVVGGLVLSISSSYAKYGHKNKAVPLIYFHLARLIGFFVLGGIIGFLGSMFTLNNTTNFILNLVLFIVMLIMGIDLLGIFEFTKAIQLKMPKGLTKNTIFKEQASYITPIILGIGTFFLPCGFTQSMQFYTLTTGSFITGAITMFVFSLGTLPILALISIASVKFSKKVQSGLFFKTAGFIIIFLAIFNFIAALVATGLMNPY